MHWVRVEPLLLLCPIAMRILFITPGSGDKSYCGNCYRDALYARSLERAGNDVVLMPLYLPVGEFVSKRQSPIFFSATAFYVACKIFRGRRIPRLLEEILNSRPMLKIAASMSGTTSSSGMERMTLAMIDGENEAFNEQAELLVHWITNHYQPHVVHISSSLLIGIAKYLKNRIKAKVVCSIQDEEIWIDELKKPWDKLAWQNIGENARFVDTFVTTSNYYRRYIATKVPLIKDVEVVYPGVELPAFAGVQYPDNPTIGFFNRMSRANGLGDLVDAFISLKKKGTIPNLKLKLAGGYSGEDDRFIKELRKQLKPYACSVEFVEGYELARHEDFMNTITVLCVPIRYNEAASIYLIEAMAGGKPVVQPARGSFEEIVGAGGVLYPEGELARALERILSDSALYKECSQAAKILALARYDESKVAARLEQTYATK